MKVPVIMRSDRDVPDWFYDTNTKILYRSIVDDLGRYISEEEVLEYKGKKSDNEIVRIDYEFIGKIETIPLGIIQTIIKIEGDRQNDFKSVPR